MGTRGSASPPCCATARGSTDALAGGSLYPRLAPYEALLEGAYTPEAYRGQGIIASAMALIAERAGDFGARWVVTFVDETNVASLKGCARAGFVPYLRRRVRFTPLS